MTPTSELRLVVTKVSWNAAELVVLDANRGHYGRAEFLRAAGLSKSLQAAPGEVLAQTLSTTARVQSCFHHINDIASVLNITRLNEGEEAAARQLLSMCSRMKEDFIKFRVNVFGALEF